MSNEILHDVRSELLMEASASSAMLADIAGLERYVAESYSARAFIELLQNADDAGANTVEFVVRDDWIICANSGRRFNEQDFRSICRSASSQKERGKSIGYRGIGFKSVVGIATTIHLMSGSIEATFDRKLTRAALNMVDIPVPLVRIPHPLSLTSDELHTEIDRLKKDRFTTIFVLEGINHDLANTEIAKFDSDHLIFLNAVQRVEIHSASHETYECERSSDANGRTIVVAHSPRKTEEWLIEADKGISLAFAIEQDRPSPLKSDEAKVHAFLPTLEPSGLGIRVNGDFSTDPSRTRVVIDEHTKEKLEAIADILSTKITVSLERQDQSSLQELECLVPNFDKVSAQFQNPSFRSVLASRLSEKLAPIRDILMFRPPWLNVHDSEKIGEELGVKLVPFVDSEKTPVTSLARFVQSPSLTSEVVFSAAKSGTLSIKGCAELVSHVTRTVVPIGITMSDLVQAEVWATEGGLVNIDTAITNHDKLTEEYVEFVRESGTSIDQLANRIDRVRSHASAVIAEHVVSAPPDSPSGLSEFDGFKSGETAPTDIFAPRSTPAAISEQVLGVQAKWRTAEKIVLELLNSHGFEAEDRSRQNIGYDIYAKLERNEFHLEVKSISYPGQPFDLTPNEESTARTYGDNYIIALVLQTNAGANVQFVVNPMQKLVFVKQCRQWVWHCTEYKFQPQAHVSNG